MIFKYHKRKICGKKIKKSIDKQNQSVIIVLSNNKGELTNGKRKTYLFNQ